MVEISDYISFGPALVFRFEKTVPGKGSASLYVSLEDPRRLSWGRKTRKT